MSDNTTLPTGSGGDVVRTIDRAGVKTQVATLDFGGEAGPESLVTTVNGFPVQPATGSSWLTTNANLDVALSTILKPSDTLAGVTTVGTITNPVTVNVITGFALESGGNLAAIKADVDKIPAQGQAVAAASMPVVLPASQITTLTPPAAITNYALETGGNLATVVTNTAPLVASGAGGYIRQDSTATIAKESGGNLATIATNLPAKGAAAIAASMPVNIASDQVVPVSGTFWQTTQPVSAAILPLPTNAAQESGGNLDKAVALDRVRSRLLIQQLSLYHPTNGFVPMEVQEFLGAL